MSAVPCKIVPLVDNHFVCLAIGFSVPEISAAKPLSGSDGATLILLYFAYQALLVSSKSFMDDLSQAVDLDPEEEINFQ